MSRRAFLRLSAALGCAASLKLTAPLRIASTWPLPFPHDFYPEPETLLLGREQAYDLLLVPAHAAADLIRRGALADLEGPPDRAHDPDGVFTRPYTWAVSVLVSRGPAPAVLEDLWARDALWPDSARLVIGAALLRRGYPLNDAHPGHLAQAERDLLELRPRLVRDPLAAVRSGRERLALSLVSREALQDTRTSGARELSLSFPTQGSALMEYDWVRPIGAQNPRASLAFMDQLTAPTVLPPSAHRLTPLTPLPLAARAQRGLIWSRVRQAGQRPAEQT